MEIRVMTIDDYDKVYDLWMATPGMGLNNLDDTREGIDKYLKRNPNTCFVALDNDRVIGVIVAGNDGRRGYIYHTAVHPDFRFQGIGRELVNAALDALSDEGINKVALVAFVTNENGNRFWERMGFTTREDLVYRNKTIKEMVKYNT